MIHGPSSPAATAAASTAPTEPNVACGECSLPVASRIDNCSLWQALRLAPNAVCRVSVDGADAAPLSWSELRETGAGTPPFEPITTWGSRFRAGH